MTPSGGQVPAVEFERRDRPVAGAVDAHGVQAAAKPGFASREFSRV
jgi:hypothetical protein